MTLLTVLLLSCGKFCVEERRKKKEEKEEKEK
jgi:hypothetical protein